MNMSRTLNLVPRTFAKVKILGTRLVNAVSVALFLAQCNDEDLKSEI